MALPTTIVDNDSGHNDHHEIIHALMVTGESVQIKLKAGTPVDGDFASTPSNGTIVINSSTDRVWYRKGGVWTEITSASGAPTDIPYLVTGASAALSAEVVVGTTPSGELGGTWGSPTVDATHSGSAHADHIAKSIVNAKGEIIVGTADNVVDRLAPGTNNQVLTADSAQTTGVKWATSGSAGAQLNLPNVFTEPQTISGGSTATNRVNLGTDTNFHRAATNTLQTDGYLRIKGKSPWADVKAWGATADEVTDDAPAIQAAINSLDDGGTLFFPRGIYCIDSTLKFYYGGIRIKGATGGPWGTTATLQWQGSPGGKMIQIGPDESNPSATPYSVTIENMRLDANNVAGTCVHILIGNHHQILNTMLYRFTGKGLRLGDDPTYDNTIQQFYSRQLVIMGADQATCGIYIKEGASEEFIFVQTEIHTQPGGAARLLRAIELVQGHASFFGLNNTGTSDTRYGIWSDQAIGIYDWLCEDRMPLFFSSTGHNKGTVISGADLRSCNPIAGEYAISVGDIGNGGVVVLDGVSLDGIPAGTRAPIIGVFGNVVATGVRFRSAANGSGDGNLTGSFQIGGAGRLIEVNPQQVRSVGGDISVESVGDDHPRVVLTTTGTIKLGNGVSAPSSVDYGAANSGGAGFKVLRLPN